MKHSIQQKQRVGLQVVGLLLTTAFLQTAFANPVTNTSINNGNNTDGTNDKAYLTLPTHINDPVILTAEDIDANKVNSEPSQYLQVYVGHGHVDKNSMAMVGDYRIDNHTLSFTPRYDFIAGQTYTVTYKLHNSKNGNEQPIATTFTITPNAIMPAEVSKIYPSGDSLPENALRFYIHFSQPMQPHVAFEHIKLVDENGTVDDKAFMQFKQELWNANRTRLTVLVDPGRIKRGVATNERIGTALHEGKRYELVVDGSWQTADGRQVLAEYRKPFIVSPALRTLPNLDNWQITAPSIGTTEPLIIDFDRPFDYQRLQKDIRILADGQAVTGSIRISNNETRWQFTPTTAWSSSEVELMVDSNLEDVAGNNFKDLLDHDVSAGVKDINFISRKVPLPK